MAVLWNNEATCRRNMGDIDGSIAAANEGLTHYTTPAIKAKLEFNLAECAKPRPEPSPEEVAKKAEKIEEAKVKVKEQKKEFKEISKKVVESEGGIYGEEGSAQKDYKVPGPFICPMNEAQDMGLGPPPAPKPWW